MDEQGGSQSQRKLKVDLSDLETAFDDAMSTTSYYLDLDTGDVVAINEDIRYELERDEEDEDQDEDDEELSEEDWGKGDRPEWMQEAIKTAKQVEAGLGTRYIEVPPVDSGEGYRDMEDFIDTVRNPLLQDRLSNAIGGRGAFRRFKDALADYPEERERWFAFKNECLRQRVVEWLHEEGIEPVLDEG